MRSDAKLILITPDGDSMMSSPRGDEYWLSKQAGGNSKLTVQQAVRLWVKYENNENVKAQHPDPRPTKTKSRSSRRDQESELLDVSTLPDRSGLAASPEFEKWKNELIRNLGLAEDEDDQTDRTKRTP